MFARSNRRLQILDRSDALSEFSAELKRARRWAYRVYAITAVVLMLFLFGVGCVWFPDIQKLAFVFRDPAKTVGDDGRYGAIVGILIGALFLAPSALLPLLFVAIADRIVGKKCPACHASLTLWKRGEVVLKSGKCPRCLVPILGSVAAESTDEWYGESQLISSALTWLIAVLLSLPVIALVLIELLLIRLVHLEKGPGLGPLLSHSEMRVAWTLIALIALLLAAYLRWLFVRFSKTSQEI